jgi:hypothetical protein
MLEVHFAWRVAHSSQLYRDEWGYAGCLCRKKITFCPQSLAHFSTAFHSKTLDTLYTMKVDTNPWASGSRMVLLVNVGSGICSGDVLRRNEWMPQKCPGEYPSKTGCLKMAHLDFGSPKVQT